MSEHQVVVVFDVTAVDEQQAAAALVAGLDSRAGGLSEVGALVERHGAQLESWWLPEARFKHLDGNDNTAAFYLEYDDGELPPGLYIEDDAEDDPTIWLATDDPERPLALLGHCAFARLVGGDDHALPLWHRLTAGLPTSPPAEVPT